MNLNKENSAKINEFIQQVHKLNLKTCVFDDTKLFYKFVDDNLKGSVEVTSLIFAEPFEILEEVSELSVKDTIDDQMNFSDSRQKLSSSISTFHVLLGCSFPAQLR